MVNQLDQALVERMFKERILTLVRAHDHYLGIYGDWVRLVQVVWENRDNGTIWNYRNFEIEGLSKLEVFKKIVSFGSEHPAYLTEDIEEQIRQIIADWEILEELVSKWEETKEQLVIKEQELNTEKEKTEAIANLISPNQPYFTQLHQELKRLKIQELNIQIPLKKQELEQNTNNLKNSLGSSAKYLLDKLLKKQKKLLQNNENASDKLEKMKQALEEDLGNSSERLEEVLNKQTELFSLEKHLDSLQNEQVAQVVQVQQPSRNN